MADASAKRVKIVMRSWTAITVYALLSATPAFAAGGGAIAWDRETGKCGCKLEPNDAKTGCGSCNQSMRSRWLQRRVKGSSNDVWCAGDFGG
jgi:hypothetical protein